MLRPPLTSADTCTQLLAAVLLDAGLAREAAFQQILATDAELAHWTAQQARLSAEPLPPLAAWLSRYILAVFPEPDLEISASRASAQTLLTLLSRLRRLATLEEAFQAQLQVEKLAAMRELAYGASHEVNNPLANIATRAQTLMREEPDPEKRRKLAVINTQAFRAYEMMADMMLFAKPPAPVFQSLNLAEIVAAAATELLPLAAAQGTKLFFDTPHSAMLASFDPAQIVVAIRALGQNALDSLRQGGQVEVILRQTVGLTQVAAKEANSQQTNGQSIPQPPSAWGLTLPPQPASKALQWAEIEVSDNGPGLDARSQRHLFDPFFSGREAGRGLGLGLSKCFRIMELHGGQIAVQSKPGCGATFILRLPLA